MKMLPKTLGEQQRWMLEAITQPEGAQGDGVAGVIMPSRLQTSEERLAVYQHAYVARLLEVLRELLPCTRFALGDELFDAFAIGYLEKHPPRSYTLDRLADRLVEYLEATRPVDWGGFVVELVRLELAIDRIFDGPGPEGMQPFELPPSAGGGLRLKFVPGFELFSFASPVSLYYTDWKSGRNPPWPEEGRQFVALFRRDYVVRRFELTEGQFGVLSALASGSTLRESVEAVGERGESLTEEQIRRWFSQWAVAGFFAAAHRAETPELPGG
jgi:hypothetical protein